MTGVILCNKCRKKMDGVCECGNYKCLICVYWGGKHYEYRRDEQGYVFTYDKAKDRLIEISNAIKKGIFKPVDFTDARIAERKFENQIDKWLDGKINQEKMGELSPGTTRNYASYTRHRFTFFEGIDVKDITREHLENFKDTLGGISIKTRKNILNALRNFFFWLKERETINVMPRFPMVKGDDSKTVLTIDYELQAEVLQHIPEMHRDPIEFMMETGLRPGEVCALLVEHVDLRNGTARIERTYVSGNKIRETSKQKRKRIIPLSDRALEIAGRHIDSKLPKQFLFINAKTGKGYFPNALWFQWSQHSGLPGVSLYGATRHSFATQLIQHNDVTVVKELMGHSDIRTTQKYVHMRMTKLSDVVNNRHIIKLASRVENRSETEAALSGSTSNNIK